MDRGTVRFIQNVLRSTLLHVNKTTKICIQFLIELVLVPNIAEILLAGPLSNNQSINLNMQTHEQGNFTTKINSEIQICTTVYILYKDYTL